MHQLPVLRSGRALSALYEEDSSKTFEELEAKMDLQFPRGDLVSVRVERKSGACDAAHSFNGRPRQTLDRMTPSERLAEVLQ